MDLQNTVKMEPQAATKAFAEYRAAVMQGPRAQEAAAKREWRATDKALRDGYKALAEGKTLISLAEAIRQGGADENGRPKLAIGRADEQHVTFWRWRSVVTFAGWQLRSRSVARADDRRFELRDVLPPAAESASPPSYEGQLIADLPFIPPQYRPPHALSNYHLLWEAEWHAAPRSQRLDPVLLKRLGGDLFAVVAAWDLTELEKLVLAR